MTELEHIEIEGFKGLEHVEFEPTDINVITGRNNTGKTSLLEAIDLLLNPTHIQDFDGNINHVINVEYDVAEVRADMPKSTKEVTLRKPSPSEVKRHFSDVIPKFVSMRTSFLRIGPSEDKDMDLMNEKLHDLVQRAIGEEIGAEEINQFQNGLLIISTNNEEHPYFSSSASDTEFIERLQKRINYELEEASEQGVVEDLITEQMAELLDGSSFKSLSIDLSVKSSFLTTPDDTDKVNFIKSISFAQNKDRNTNGDKPVKIDDIGDYIMDAGIVDNLKTFTLDYLVFEDRDGSKYQIPFDFMGDGLKSIVGILWELIDDEVENEIVLIEEPETHMHPGYVSELVHFLIDLAQDENIQFFITTHNHDFIKDFFAEMPKEKRKYLEEEFSLVKMDDFGADVLNYDDAEHHLKDLHLDLRGI